MFIHLFSNPPELLCKDTQVFGLDETGSKPDRCYAQFNIFQINRLLVSYPRSNQTG